MLIDTIQDGLRGQSGLKMETTHHVTILMRTGGSKDPGYSASQKPSPEVGDHTVTGWLRFSRYIEGGEYQVYAGR